MELNTDAASDVRRPEAAVLTGTDCSFSLCSVVVHLVQRGLLEMHVLIVFFDTMLNSVLDIKWIIDVSWVARGNWHDGLFDEVVVSQTCRRQYHQLPTSGDRR